MFAAGAYHRCPAAQVRGGRGLEAAADLTIKGAGDDGAAVNAG